MSTPQSRVGPAERYEPDFETRVCGIPCWIAISYFEPEIPDTWDEQGQNAYAEFNIVDANGYPMRFLERKLTQGDIDNITIEISKHAKKNHEI